MRIIIDDEVHQAIEDFYRAAMANHITLSFETVENKKNRLFDAFEDLRYNHRIYPQARLKQDWIEAGWQEFVCEDFHSAFEYGHDQYGEEVVAVHSLLYY